MKYYSIALVLALAQSTSALQLQDDVRLSEDDLFLQLAEAPVSKPSLADTKTGSNPTYGVLSASGWGPLAAGKASLDYMDDTRSAHSGTVQNHLSNRAFTPDHNSADELNSILKKKGDENENDAEPK